jgi:hypothetical protein
MELFQGRLEHSADSFSQTAPVYQQGESPMQAFPIVSPMLDGKMM